MPAAIIDGRAVAEELRAALRDRSRELRARSIVPCLVVVIVGDDGASIAYARSLSGSGAKLDIDVRVETLPDDTTESDLCGVLQRLDDDPVVHGIILQQPLPAHLSIRTIASAIPARKDVDGANPINRGRLAFESGTAFVPATPAAVMTLLERSPAWPARGRSAVVIGRSSVVGLPVSLLLLAQDATVTIAHSKTRDLAAVARSAEILVVATGRPGMVTGAMIAPGATVIDAGTTVVDGKLVGDVEFASACEAAGAITPVPGGVGPVTNVALMRNVITAAESLASGDPPVSSR